MLTTVEEIISTSWVPDIVEGQVKAQAFLYYLLAGCGQERERDP